MTIQSHNKCSHLRIPSVRDINCWRSFWSTIISGSTSVLLLINSDSEDNYKMYCISNKEYWHHIDMVICKLIDDHVLQNNILTYLVFVSQQLSLKCFFFILLGHSQIIRVYGGIQKHSKIFCRNKMQRDYFPTTIGWI